MPFSFERVDGLEDVVRVVPKRFDDERGWFEESYKASAFEGAGLPARFVQDNAARNTRRGVLRGLHLQRPPAEQGKLVRCSLGRVWDVAVDVRPESSTFRAWHGEELSDATGVMLWIPPGYAHGYVTLTDATEVGYKVAHEYDPERETGIRWDDEALGIDWPVDDPFLSARDASAPSLSDFVENAGPHS